MWLGMTVHFYFLFYFFLFFCNHFRALTGVFFAHKKNNFGGKKRKQTTTTMTSENLSPIVLCGPSGSGKSTLMKKLMEEFEGKFGFSVSNTTRVNKNLLK